MPEEYETQNEFVIYSILRNELEVISFHLLEGIHSCAELRRRMNSGFNDCYRVICEL